MGSCRSFRLAALFSSQIDAGACNVEILPSLLQQPGPKKFKLFQMDLIYKARKFKVLPLAILVPIGKGLEIQ